MAIEFQRLQRIGRALLDKLTYPVLLILFLVITTVLIPSQSLAATLTPLSVTAPATTADASTLFELNCAGCHANGGNVIRRGKNLKKRAMARNGYESVDAIADIITHGKGIMSSYSDRLSSEEINAIAQYVHKQSQSNWK